MLLKTKLFPILILVFIFSCNHSATRKFDNQVIPENKFIDKELREIYQLQVDQNIPELINFLKDSNPLNRETAALAFASLQDTSALNELIQMLSNDKSIRVRTAAAYAIGQTSDTIVEEQLLKIAGTEQEYKVKNSIYEAIGKCGTIKGHQLLTNLLINKPDSAILKGLLLGLARYSIRGKASEEAIKKIVEILNDQAQSIETRYYSSIYLIRVKGFDLSKYAATLQEAYLGNDDVFTKMNIVTAMSKAKNKVSFDFLSGVLATDGDYRIKVNAIKSLTNFSYSDINKLINNLLFDSNVNIAVQASEYFLANGIKQDAAQYFATAKKLTNWRVRTNVFIAALRLSDQNPSMAAYIKNEYRKSVNTYEKANLLKALSGDFNSFDFIKNEISNSPEIPVKTAGTEALADMRRTVGYDLYRSKRIQGGRTDPGEEFALVFRDAISSDDVARVAIAAEILRDTLLGFRQIYENTFFLTQALNACRLPAEIETYRELQKTIAFFNGTIYKEEVLKSTYKPDWQFISEIPFNQQIEIKTSKGIIDLDLFVNDAPISVSNFLKLASEGYFNNKMFHRIVPNFVVQDGCPRGDGWGGPEYSICSEFAMNYYSEGSLGMASAGKDTESSQWFITHSPTPHLDGRYTNFGKIVKGMDVVHALEMGDTIFYIKAIVPEK